MGRIFGRPGGHAIEPNWFGQGGAGSISLEVTSETDTLGVIATVAPASPVGGRSASTIFTGVKRSGESQPAVYAKAIAETTMIAPISDR